MKRLLLFALLPALIGLLLPSCASVSMQHCRPETHPLPDEAQFVKLETASHGKKYPFWHTRNTGKPVLLLHAMNGISPRTAELALEMETWGYRVYIPSLFGPDVLGNDPYGYNSAIKANGLTMLSPDWDTQSPDNAGQILEDVREMSKWVSKRENDADVVVIGNCLTGIFPLGLINESHISTGVLCQPATPIKNNMQILLRFPQPKRLAGSLGISNQDLQTSLSAMKADPSKQIIGFHYVDDPLAPIEKFEQIYKKMNEATISSQFTTYVMSTDEKSPSHIWTHYRQTDQRRKLFSPHSTVINPPSCEDREWFRASLREALSNAVSK